MSKRFASSAEIQAVVEKALKSNKWELLSQNGHNKLRHKDTNKIVVAPYSPSCPRAAKNLARDIRHVEAGMPGWGVPNIIDTKISLKRKHTVAVA